MNKKGFTLAEILGVIVIIALLLLLLMPTIIDKMAQNGDKAGEINDSLIYDAVDNYIEENIDINKSGTYCIPIQDLVDDGKLVDPVIDVETGEDITDKTVYVTIDNDGNITHQIVEKDECDANSNLHQIDFIINPDNNNWVHGSTTGNLCKDTTWMISSTDNESFWSLTGMNEAVILVITNSSIPDYYYANSQVPVKPIIYLSKDIKITDGDGSQSNPYEISL